MSDEHFRKLENMYHAAPINRFYEPRLTIERGRTELSFAARPELHHAAGAVHGSVYFKALDDAAFFAVSSLVEDVFVLTASFHLHLLKPVSLGTLLARGMVVHETKSTFVADAVLVDADGTALARGSGSFVRSKIPLTPAMGYAV